MTDTVSDDIRELRRLTEASAWRVALSEADLETSEEFEAWLALDPRHAEAWAQVNGPWDAFGAQAMAPELIIARRDALERARRHQQRRFGRAGPWGGMGRRVAAAALVALVIGGAGGFGVWRVTRPDTYQTALGERRAITLADGSQVMLDSDTLLKVKLRARTRSLDLLKGQARFKVAHDVTRPFTVHARDKTVVATGTSFNVDLLGPGVVVTLIEGRVSVLQDQAPALLARASGRPVVVAKLSPGQKLVALQPAAELAPGAPAAVVEVASLDRATAWEGGQLVFDNEPLSAVAARVGRYAPHPVIAEGRAADMRLSGVFDAGDLRTFTDAVQRVLPVTVETTPDGAIHLRAATS